MEKAEEIPEEKPFNEERVYGEIKVWFQRRRDKVEGEYRKVTTWYYPSQICQNPACNKKLRRSGSTNQRYFCSRKCAGQIVNHLKVKEEKKEE